MRIALAAQFRRNIEDLSQEQRLAVSRVVDALPTALGKPHLHAGLGLRKLHASGIWEGRVGLGLRLVFALKMDLVTLTRVGAHEEVRRYLKSL